MEVTETNVKKYLYKNKGTMAVFSHYVSGNIYYTVAIEDEVYQFPIETVEDRIEYSSPELQGEDEIEFNYIALSSDLGTTPFYASMKGSDLNRWIAKAIKAEEFIKVGLVVT